MKEFIQYIKEYSDLLKNCAVWHNTQEIISPVIGTADKDSATDNYVFEFYCYIKIIDDLRTNYEIEFIEGEGPFKYKFPQAAAIKKGKPRFHALKDGELKFQVCAGTMIKCPFDSEENHPDISFQIATATDTPEHTDIILIMDAKYKEDKSSKLPKDEIYKFGAIVDLFDLKKIPSFQIEFNHFKQFHGNCLITNAKSYSTPSNTTYLNRIFVKEVEQFFPGSNFNVIG